jgi:DNA-binding protein YbaB
MALPTPETLAPGIVAVEHALALLEGREAPKTVTVTSSDGNFSAVANGNVSLAQVTIAEGVFNNGDAGALANGAAMVCAQALANANAIMSAAAATDAATYDLPGVARPSAPPPTDSGFDRTVGTALASAPVVAEALRQSFFEGRQGTVRAQVNGALELSVLQYLPPLPGSKEALEAATVAAINTALVKAKNIFEPTARSIIDVGTGIGPRIPDLRPQALLVVGNAVSLRPSDELLRARLASTGFDVEIRKAPSAAAADTNGRTLIVISESAQPADVGTKFTNAAVPVIALEPQQFRDLKMTGGVSGTDHSEAMGQTQLQITAGHVLAVGLSGKVTVTRAASKFEWGKPAAGAVKVAGIVGKTNQWGIFAYDTGDQMVGANAPARRVGFFAGQDTPAVFTEDGWRLFEAAVRWATAAKALMTVGSAAPLSSSDAVLKKRLEDRHGLEVLVRLARDMRTNDLGDLRVHLISDSVDSADVGARFLTSPAPTVNCEAPLFDDMKMTGTKRNSDFGVTANQADLDIAAPGHPLAAGLTGRVRVVSPAQPFGWGKVGSEAIKVATLIGQSNRAGVFGYESGANMVGTRAPAPRVGLFAEEPSPAAFAPAGLALLDAAIRWARRPRALLVAGALPLRPADEAMRSRLEKAFGFVVDVKLGKDPIDKIAAGKKLIVVSESVESADVGSKLTTLAVPVLALEPALFDDMKMTGTTQKRDFGVTANQADLDIAALGHPLAAGLSVERATVATAPAKFGWGKPGANAAKIARVVGKADQWAIFGYEGGVGMVGANAPARRVGWFAERDTFTALNDTGLRLFDAAVLWAAGRPEIFPQLDQIADLVRGVGQSG